MFMGRPLPNHDIYMEKLSLYAEACEITIEYRDIDGDAAYIPSRRVIKLDKDMPESTEVAALAHELGHCNDDALQDDVLWKKIDKAYQVFYKGSANKKQKILVLECEQRAWDHAKGICKKLRIPLGKWFTEEEKDSLDSYKESADAEKIRAE